MAMMPNPWAAARPRARSACPTFSGGRRTVRRTGRVRVGASAIRRPVCTVVLTLDSIGPSCATSCSIDTERDRHLAAHVKAFGGDLARPATVLLSEIRVLDQASECLRE
jgi:hypothetical protein